MNTRRKEEKNKLKYLPPGQEGKTRTFTGHAWALQGYCLQPWQQGYREVTITEPSWSDHYSQPLGDSEAAEETPNTQFCPSSLDCS